MVRRLPVVNGDDGQWGTILNNFLNFQHFNDGTDTGANNGAHMGVTIMAGNASVAPLTFTGGTNLTTAADGAVEYDSTSYFGTISTTRLRFALYPGSTTGDMYYHSAQAGQLTNLGIGSSGSFLIANTSAPVWTTTPNIGAATGSTLVLTNTSANGLTDGANGTTNPVFNVDSSTASVQTGINFKGAAVGGGMAISTLSANASENLTIDAKGVGTISLGTLSTTAGSVIIGNITAQSQVKINSQVAINSNIGSANALFVARNSFNAALNVDTSVSGSTTGFNIKSALAGNGIALTAISSSANENITFDAKGTGTVGINTTGSTSGLVTIGNTTSLAGASINGLTTITSKNSSSLAVGANGSTNPVLQIDASTASVQTGISFKGAAVGSGLAVTTISASASENMTIDAKGIGFIKIGSVSTGGVEIDNPRLVPRASVSGNTGTSLTPNTDLKSTSDDFYYWNYTGSSTITLNNDAGTNQQAGMRLIVRLNTTNTVNMSFGTQYRGSADFSLPNASTGNSKTDYMGFLWNENSSNWDLVAMTKGF